LGRGMSGHRQPPGGVPSGGLVGGTSLMWEWSHKPWVGGEWVDEVLGWSELLGWEARCTCGWVGPLYRRGDDEQEPTEHLLVDAPHPDAEAAIEAAWLIHEAAHQ